MSKEANAPTFTEKVFSDRQQLATGGILFLCLGFMLAGVLQRRLQKQTLIDIERPFHRSKIQLAIDLNEAPWQEFTLLPDVSETLARRIVEFRSQNGRFRSLDELQQVQGIGPRTLELVRPFFVPLDPSFDPEVHVTTVGAQSGDAAPMAR